jgi:signal transduction histidine kinase
MGKKYIKAINESIDILNSLNYSEQFLDLLPDFIFDHFTVSNITLFYINKEKTRYKPYFPSNQAKIDFSPIDENSHLVIDLKNAKKTLLLIKEKPAKISILKKTNPDLFEKLKIDLVIPLLSLNKLSGFLIIEANKKTFKELENLNIFFKILSYMIIPIISFERTHIENSRNYYRIYRMDRLALVGELAASAAHEIKNPLAGISTYIKYFSEKKDIKRDDFISELEIMKQSTQRINDIIKSLLSFSKYAKKEVRKIDLSEIIETTIQSIALKIPKNIKIIKEIDSGVFIKTDGHRLQQVLINILFNAIDAIGKNKGEISVRTYITGRDQLPENELFNISIKDTGPGIKKSFKEKLFQPFQTTKEEGTGLGLYTCYGLMKSLGGDIEINSSKKGTEVILSLPFSFEEDEEE